VVWWVGQGRALAGAGKVLGADAPGMQRGDLLLLLLLLNAADKEVYFS